MVKISRKTQWKPVEIDGTLLQDGAEGLVGIEECTDYDMNDFLPLQNDGKTESKQKKKSKKTPKETVANLVSIKKPAKQKKKSKKIVDKSPSKEGSTTSDDFVAVNNDEDNEDETATLMLPWNIVPLPATLIKGLAEQKFYQPTEIQSLTLPAAILGHRDILGAAETGSGKTLAFGLPILSGILQLKQNQSESEARDVNVEESETQDCDSNEESETQDCDSDEESETQGGDSDEESDFEECEEDVEGLNNGIGCVKSINNVKMGNASPKKPLYALILTPTRELAVQIKNHLVAAAKYTGIRVVVVVGGMASVKQERVLNKGPEIVVATPGRLWELIQQGNEHLSQIDDIRYLAIDETDRMIEKGHFQELHHILERVNMVDDKRKKRQNFVFSATLTLVHELPTHLVTKKKLKGRKYVSDMTPQQKLENIVEILGISNPKVVDITKGKGTSGTLLECRITCDLTEKDYYVYYFIQRHPGRTIIFCNSIGCVKRLTTLLGLLDCNPLPLHASMQQRQRLKNLDRFREKEDSILVATDVAARGLDIPAIEHVIHYQTPRTSESYVHRSGRTARASREGITVLLVEPSELPNYLRLCRTLGKTEDIPLFPVQQNYLNAVKKRVNLAVELDKLDLQVRKANSESGWFQKAAEEMDMIIDEVSMKYDTKEAKIYKKSCDFKRKQLMSLLAKPIFPKGLSGKYPLNGDTNDLLIAQGQHVPETALTVMKNSMDASAVVKRQRPKVLFKPKIKKNETKFNGKDLLTSIVNRNFKKNKSAIKKNFRKNK